VKRILPTTYKVAEIGEGTLTVMAKPATGKLIDEEFYGLKCLVGIKYLITE